MNELEALKAELSPLAAEFDSLGAKITAENAEPTADEKARFDELHGQIKSLQGQIADIQNRDCSERERIDRLNHFKAVREEQAKLEEYIFRTPNDEETFRRADQNDDYSAALTAWYRMGEVGGGTNLSPKEADACRRLGANACSKTFKVTDQGVLKAHAAGLRDTYAKLKRGGYTAANVMLEGEFLAADTDALDSRVPERAGYLNRQPEFLAVLAQNEVAFGGVLAAPITVMITDHYEDVTQTYGDDTTHTGRQIGESQTIGTTLTPSFGNVTWKNYDFTSDDVVVSTRQLERSRFDLPSYIAVALGQRLGRVQGTTLTTGSGANTPQGIVTASTAMGTYTTTAVTLVVGYDDIINTEFMLDPAMWNTPNTGWMMHPKALPLLRLIKDGNGLPIFQIGKEGNRTALLDGYPIYWNNAMTAPTSGAFASADKAMLFGNFGRYVVRRAGGGMPTLIRDETTNRRTLQTIFTALINFDARVADYGTNPFGELRVL